jgi:hypothetical protein
MEFLKCILFQQKWKKNPIVLRQKHWKGCTTCFVSAYIQKTVVCQDMMVSVEIQQTSKLQNKGTLFDVELCLTVHKSFFIKYHVLNIIVDSWLHVSS